MTCHLQGMFSSTILFLLQVLARGNVINVPVKIGGDPSKIDATNGSMFHL